jgi:hypothetical protein
MVNFKVKNEKGLEKIGAVLLPGLPDSLYHKSLSSKLFGVAMYHQAGLPVFCGVQNNSPGFSDHNISGLALMDKEQLGHM